MERGTAGRDRATTDSGEVVRVSVPVPPAAFNPLAVATWGFVPIWLNASPRDGHCGTAVSSVSRKEADHSGVKFMLPLGRSDCRLDSGLFQVLPRI